MSDAVNSHAYSKLATCDTKHATKFFPWEKRDGKNWAGERWQSPNAFRYSSKERMWAYLEELHRGVRNGKWTNDSYYTHADNVAIVENFAYQMGLTKAETARARAAFFSIHHKRIRGERKDVTAVAVCAYIGENAGREFHPQKRDENGVRLAERYAEMFACEPDDVVSRYGKVQFHLRDGIPQNQITEARASSGTYLHSMSKAPSSMTENMGGGGDI